MFEFLALQVGPYLVRAFKQHISMPAPFLVPTRQCTCHVCVSRPTTACDVRYRPPGAISA